MGIHLSRRFPRIFITRFCSFCYVPDFAYSPNPHNGSSGSDRINSEPDLFKAGFCFPMLKELDLSGNIFAIIPETLLLFTHLKSLRLNKCKKLQEIPALPRNIKRLEARDCELLERYSPLDKEGKGPARPRVVDFSNCHKLAKNEGKNVEDAFFSKVGLPTNSKC
ncbi:DISEASE RESISTANCE PROTEIN TAO1-LIKE [Salix purpurea]|uniref:DISEASE RESISTANCE PROTEIN TAO1-LIKE n=1 Tax=Salix purpurea TaxID=77065 RepID=A0A9Q0ZRS3_SALPP|nr:DISEASE RESISTANCE PROTEIN TAO1-LIKE [Salix purpurea]